MGSYYVLFYSKIEYYIGKEEGIYMINFAYILQKIRFIYRIKASGLFSFEKFSSMLNFTHNINNLDHQCGTLIRKRRLIEKFSNSSQ